jgi:hypothetical protein
VQKVFAVERHEACQRTLCPSKSEEPSRTKKFKSLQADVHSGITYRHLAELP